MEMSSAMEEKDREGRTGAGWDMGTNDNLKMPAGEGWKPLLSFKPKSVLRTLCLSACLSLLHLADICNCSLFDLI